MDWLRWYHGSCTDPKFRVVAKRAARDVEGIRVSDVVSVWSMILERASSNEESRGCFSGFDCEAADEAFGLPDGASSAILVALDAKELTKDNWVVNWKIRQPKRERDDDSAARVKAHRERKKQASNASFDNVTPCNATQRQETPRGEEIREEENTKTPPIPPSGVEGGGYALPSFEPEPEDHFDPADMPSLEFEEFFDSYPKQVDKAKAWNAWRKLGRTNPGLASLQASIVEQSQSDQWTRDHGRYIPSPAKWLQERKWLDKLSPAPTSLSAGASDVPDWMRYAGSCVKEATP